MSRRSFSNHLELMSIARHCCSQAAERSMRAVVVIELTSESCLVQLAQSYALPFIEASNSIDRSDRIASLLGTEQPMLVHQLAARFDTGLFAALSGTIKAGGALIVGLPPDSPSHSYQRFHKILMVLQHRYPAMVVTARYLPNDNEQPERPSNSLDQLHKTAAPRVSLAAREEQDRLFDKACNYLTRHQHACILITGRRGRGKSMLLARLANWLDGKRLGYTLTAASQSGVTTIYQHCSSAKRAFVSADNASSATTHTLLVDEAGSLPLATLGKLLAAYQQVVLSTTLEGYENAGRAFDIRFAPQIRKSHAQVLDLHPVEPWRWGRLDPLEQLVDQLLLTDQANLTNNLAYSTHPATVLTNKTPQLAGVATAAIEKPRSQTMPAVPRKIEQAELAADEYRLHSLFTLFRNTHYQTSTQDLEHLLDSPSIDIWTMENGHKIIAAVLLTYEGKIEDNLQEAIVSKKRRLTHQLLPQLLAQSANTAVALKAHYARVIRISVAQTMRRRGLASQLIQHIESQLGHQENGAQTMGASFAADPASIAFWQSNGYTEFHRGFKRNPRTGKQAVAMIKTWDSTVDSVVVHARQIHADNSLIRHQLEHTPVGRAIRATPEGNHAAATAPRHYDHSLLVRFSANERSLNDTLGSLDRFVRRHGFALYNHAGAHRKSYEASLRDAVAKLLLADWP